MMQYTKKYIVTYLSSYPCGHRHPLQMAVLAIDAKEATSRTTDALEDDRIGATNHSLFSVVPEGYSEELIGELDICQEKK
ncbi:hypothetical protein [Leminorella grimontii]|uniref:hypothetical protein n=1 Tax=Leminorella grimontii TaxID=82981 RepID=UPI00321F6AE8